MGYFFTDKEDILYRVSILTFRQILFISEYQYDCVLHFPIINNPMQFLACFFDPIFVSTIHDEDKALCARIVMPPKWPNFVLTAHILSIRKNALERMFIFSAKIRC